MWAWPCVYFVVFTLILCCSCGQKVENTIILGNFDVQVLVVRAHSVMPWCLTTRGQCGHTGAALLSISSAQKLSWVQREGKYYIIKSSWKRSIGRPGISGNSISLCVCFFFLKISCVAFLLSQTHIKAQTPFHFGMDIEFSLCRLSLSWYLAQ